MKTKKHGLKRKEVRQCNGGCLTRRGKIDAYTVKQAGTEEVAANKKRLWR